MYDNAFLMHSLITPSKVPYMHRLIPAVLPFPCTATILQTIPSAHYNTVEPIHRFCFIILGLNGRFQFLLVPERETLGYGQKGFGIERVQNRGGKGLE